MSLAAQSTLHKSPYFGPEPYYLAARQATVLRRAALLERWESDVRLQVIALDWVVKVRGISVRSRVRQEGGPKVLGAAL
jgi:hypothetical protein